MNSEIDALQRHPLLDAAFKEVLRMYAPAGTLVPAGDQGHRGGRATTSPARARSPSGVRLDAAARLVAEPRHLRSGPVHRRRDAGAVHRYAFAPFGGGVHKCIGQQFADMSVKLIMNRCCAASSGGSKSDYRPHAGLGYRPDTGRRPAITLQRRAGRTSTGPVREGRGPSV